MWINTTSRTSGQATGYRRGTRQLKPVLQYCRVCIHVNIVFKWLQNVKSIYINHHVFWSHICLCASGFTQLNHDTIVRINILTGSRPGDWGGAKPHRWSNGYVMYSGKQRLQSHPAYPETTYGCPTSCSQWRIWAWYQHQTLWRGQGPSSVSQPRPRWRASRFSCHWRQRCIAKSVRL